jgi:hypothetical protein
VNPGDTRRSAPRDLRLDFFRGLALLWVFLIHTRSDLLLWFTSCNYGFSDPAEAFVFISGYAAGLAYGGLWDRAGWAAATRRMLRQAGRLYGGHLLLTLLLAAEVTALTRLGHGPRLAGEMQIAPLLAQPFATLGSALRLQFRPSNLDVLPLFVVLFATLPFVLPILDRWPAWGMAGSAGFYLLVQYHPEWNLPGNGPGQVWFFNPFAWQCLFYLGVFCGRRSARSRPFLPRHVLLQGLAWLMLGSVLLVTLSWHFPVLTAFVPDGIGPWLYPISKTSLAPVRLGHFLALAYLTARWNGTRCGLLDSPVARPIIRCGQHSLWVFGVGVLLSFVGEWILTEYPAGALRDLLVGATGLACLIGLAGLPGWVRQMWGERQAHTHPSVRT